MSNRITALLVAGALLALAFALNPSPEKHRARIKDAIGERSQLQRVLGIGHLTSFASTYHSLGVVSYTTVNEKVTSIGVMGMVFVPD